MTLYHTIRMQGGRILYVPTSISDALIEFSPTDHLIESKDIDLIKFKGKVSAIEITNKVESNG